MNLAVVGDTLLDIDLAGTATRLCPDAPVPVVDLTRESTRPGGAGLAALLAPAGDGPVAVAAPRAQVVDPCGAGDCFAATVAVQLMQGASVFEAVQSGVTAASRFLAAGGVSGLVVLEGENR